MGNSESRRLFLILFESQPSLLHSLYSSCASKLRNACLVVLGAVQGPGKSSHPPRGQSRESACQHFQLPPQAAGSRAHLHPDFSWGATRTQPHCRKGTARGLTEKKTKYSPSPGISLASAADVRRSLTWPFLSDCPALAQTDLLELFVRRPASWRGNHEPLHGLAVLTPRHESSPELSRFSAPRVIGNGSRNLVLMTKN